MLAARNYTGPVFLALLHLSFSAMVLPRPPSSSNHLQQTQELTSRKAYERKSSQNYLQNSDIKSPHINDYSFLEIELQSPDEIDVTNLQSIVHTVLKRPELHNNYPTPEVIPHSIFGVRDFGLSPNFKLKAYDEKSHSVLNPVKLQNLDGKLYYLKNSRPKVYVNVRGHSSSFRNNQTSKVTSNSDPILFSHSLRPYRQKQTEWKFQHSKKGRSSTKFDYEIATKSGNQKNYVRKESKKLSKMDSVYGLDNLSTTESSIVTSSELPKQIPAPPSKLAGRNLMVQTTPVQRMDILPGYSLLSNV